MRKLFDLLSEILAELRGIRVALTHQNAPPVRTQPFMPTVVDPYPNFPPVLPRDPINRCPKCGISLDGVMSYSCSNTQCPTGLGPITC